jgi:hypothetical protein
MKIRNKQILTGLLLILLIGLNSCKSSQQSSSNQALLKQLKAEEYVSAIVSYGIHYDTFTAPVSVALQSGKNEKKQSLNGQLRVKKGEGLQLSLKLPVLGTEVFKMVITPKQFILIDRYHKMYLSESIDNIKFYFPFELEYANLEALFTNHLFLPGYEEVEPSMYSKFKVNAEDHRVYLDYTDSQKINYAFTSDYTNRIMETKVTQKGLDAEVSWKYSDFELLPNRQLFPSKETILIKTPDDEIKMTIDFKSVELNKNFEVSMSLPKKYEQISFEQFMYIIKTL